MTEIPGPLPRDVLGAMRRQNKTAYSEGASIAGGPGGQERFGGAKKLGTWLKDTFWTKEDVRSGIITGGTLSLIRAGLNWGTGGLGMGLSVGFGAAGGALKAAQGEVYRQYNLQKGEVAGRVKVAEDSGDIPDSADELLLEALTNVKFRDLAERYRAAQDKGAITKAAIRGAAWGAVGGFVGFEIKELGIADFVKDRLGEFAAEHAGTTIGTLTGTATGLLLRLRKSRQGGEKFLSRKTIYAVLAGGVIGAGAGFVAEVAGGYKDSLTGSGTGVEGAATAVPTATIPQAVASPEAPRVVVSPEASSTATPTSTSTSTPEATRTPTSTSTPTRVPSTSTPTPAPTEAPKVVPSPTRHPILRAPGDNFQNVAYIANADSGADSFASITGTGRGSDFLAISTPTYKGEYPPEIMKDYTGWYNNLSSDNQMKFDDLLDTSKNPPGVAPLTASEPLYTDAGPHPDFAPLGPDQLSLKGQLEGLYIDNLFKQEWTGVGLDKFLSNHGLDPNDPEWEAVGRQIADSGFDPFNGKHLELRDLVMKDRGITPEQYKDRVNALYGYVKRNTPPGNFNTIHPDYFDRTKGVVLPDNMNKWLLNLEQIK